MSNRAEARTGWVSKRGIGIVMACVTVVMLTVGAGVVRAQPGEKVPAFEEPRVFTGVALRPYGLASADFNADGYPDVVVAVRGGEYGGDSIGSIVVFMNLGVDANDAWLGFAAAARYWLDLEIETKPYHVAVGNLDPSDDPLGLPDIAVSAFDSDEVFVFLNDWTNPGSFGSPDRYSLPQNFAPRGVAVGHFGNSTSWLDIAVASGLEDRVLFLGNVNGTGQFAPAGEVSLGTGVPARGIVGGEFDATGAGNEDAVTPDWTSVLPFGCQAPFLNDTISTLRNEGNYTFVTSQDVGGCGDFPRNFVGIAKGRFQGVGENDVVATEQCRALAHVILGDGLGGFSHDCATDRYQLHPDSAAVVDGVTTGQVNGGTRTDIIAAISSTNQVAVLLGRGNGMFQRPSSDSAYLYSIEESNSPPAVWPVQVIVVDLNQDGFGDIVTVNEGRINPPVPPSVSVLINKMLVSLPPQ